MDLAVWAARVVVLGGYIAFVLCGCRCRYGMVYTLGLICGIAWTVRDVDIEVKCKSHHHEAPRTDARFCIYVRGYIMYYIPRNNNVFISAHPPPQAIPPPLKIPKAIQQRRCCIQHNTATNESPRGISPHFLLQRPRTGSTHAPGYINVGKRKKRETSLHAKCAGIDRACHV